MVMLIMVRMMMMFTEKVRLPKSMVALRHHTDSHFRSDT